MKIQGACHCGDISYEAVVDPARVSICHCADCQ
ncbi:MAG: GFA family protein, partial [Pseudomonadota bacterium]|nr:GFA family protein [Pseudomonadota bacterium]